MKKVASVALVSLLVSVGASAIADTEPPVKVIEAPAGSTPDQGCVPLTVADSLGQTSVEKSVSPTSFPWLRANWNTDFTINGRANRYLATIRAKSEGSYKISVYLKYPNAPADKLFDREVDLQSDDQLVVAGVPRKDETPYQLNVFVGGIEATGNGYVASASACEPSPPPNSEPSQPEPQVSPQPEPQVSPQPQPQPSPLK